MAKTKIGSNAQFTGGGLSLSTIGDHCYAYSGSMSVAPNTETTGLSFNTGKGYIKGKFIFGMDDHAMTVNTQLEFDIFFNGVKVYTRAEEWFTDEGRKNSATLVIPITLIIPPLTLVEWKVEHTDGNNIETHMTMTGRLYDA